MGPLGKSVIQLKEARGIELKYGCMLPITPQSHGMTKTHGVDKRYKLNKDSGVRLKVRHIKIFPRCSLVVIETHRVKDILLHEGMEPSIRGSDGQSKLINIPT